MTEKTRNTTLLKSLARRHGFSFCGISEARPLEEERDHLSRWLGRRYQAGMQYLERHGDMRLDPRKLVPGARSVVSLGYNYHPAKPIARKGSYKIAKYAYGQDYHKVLRKKLKALLLDLRESVGDIEGRVFVDSAPVMERQWAAKSGLGWIGKNGLLLNRNMGSFFFLCELIIDLKLEYDGPVGDYCGTCTRCLEACPTDAFPQPGVLDAGRCISYLTIELKDAIPEDFHGRMDDWIFGCDVCQDVCPWNRFRKPTSEKKFAPDERIYGLDRRGWQELTEEVFNDIFKGSALKRTGFHGMRRNMAANKKARSGRA